MEPERAPVTVQELTKRKHKIAIMNAVHDLPVWSPATRDTYNWTVKWNMTVPGATYENTVNNRAWLFGNV